MNKEKCLLQEIAVDVVTNKQKIEAIHSRGRAYKKQDQARRVRLYEAMAAAVDPDKQDEEHQAALDVLLFDLLAANLPTAAEYFKKNIEFANEVTELEKEQEAICEKAQAKRGAESPDLKYIVRIHNKPDYPVTDFYISGGLGAARAVALDFEHRLDTPVSVRTLGGDYIPDYCRRPDGNCRACSLARPGGFDCEGAPLEDRGEGTAEEREGLPF